MKTIAVFGGTFNPIHMGHVQILQELTRLDDVEKILLIPAKIPPHKSCGFLAEEVHRIKMCEIVAEKFPNVSVCDIELKREGKSYTVDTLRALRARFPDRRLALTIGGDMVVTFTEWKDYPTILREARLLSVGRSGVPQEDFDAAVRHLRDMGGDIRIMEADIMEVSSTLIRENIGNEEALRGLLDPDVAEYIDKNQVYGDTIGL